MTPINSLETLNNSVRNVEKLEVMSNTFNATNIMLFSNSMNQLTHTYKYSIIFFFEYN